MGIQKIVINELFQVLTNGRLRHLLTVIKAVILSYLDWNSDNKVEELSPSKWTFQTSVLIDSISFFKCIFQVFLLTEVGPEIVVH